MTKQQKPIVERRPWLVINFPKIETEAILAVGVTALFAYVTIRVLGPVVPRENRDIAMIVLGALIVLTKDTFARYFSATKGAQEQRKDAAEVAKTLADAAAAKAP